MIYREMRLMIVAMVLHTMAVVLMILGWVLRLKLLKIVAIPLFVTGLALTMYSIAVLMTTKNDKLKK